MKYNIRRNIDEVLRQLPDEPGVYQFFDVNDRLLYVGKAKKLSNRVRSYFNNDHTGKTKVLVKKISDIRYITVGSEQDALLLENSLIKEHQPPYNIRLKDDKTYPWICIIDEPFPRVLKIRNRESIKGEYFGPYPSAKFVNVLVNFLCKQFKIRTCALPLSEKKIAEGKFDSCLEYQIGNCLAPCIGEQNMSEYMVSVDRIRSILKGKVNEVVDELINLRNEYAESFSFEKAHVVQSTIDSLKDYQFKSTVVSPKISGFDVLTVKEISGKWYYGLMRISNGAIISSKNGIIEGGFLEEEDSITDTLLEKLYDELGNCGNTILSDKDYHGVNNEINVEVPVIGDKRKLVELCVRNTFVYAKSKQQIFNSVKTDNLEGLNELKSVLRLNSIPYHIECFDNSNIQGTEPSSACVVFKNGEPSKKDYRHFGVKTIVGPDDFGSMKEVVSRRYRGLLEREEELPDLVLIDGGKGQLNAARSALEELGVDIPLVGIAKRLEELYVPGDKDSIILSKRSKGLMILQHLRNEAHRFSLRLHRNKRSKRAISSELDNIKGIGPETKRILLKEFGSISGVSNANKESLTNAIGPAKAKIILKYFNR